MVEIPERKDKNGNIIQPYVSPPKIEWKVYHGLEFKNPELIAEGCNSVTINPYFRGNILEVSVKYNGATEVFRWLFWDGFWDSFEQYTNYVYHASDVDKGTVVLDQDLVGYLYNWKEIERVKGYGWADQTKPHELRFTTLPKESLIRVEEDQIYGEYQLVKSFHPTAMETEISGINRYTRVTYECTYQATIHNNQGIIVPTTITRKAVYHAAPYQKVLFADSTPKNLRGYTKPGLYTFSVTPEVQVDRICWFIDGTLTAEGNSISYNLTNENEVHIECYYEKFDRDPKDYYVRGIGYDYWVIGRAIPKTVDAIDYGSCNVPYILGNGVTVDLKTGDAKISQTDLLLPGKDGLDLRLTRILSGRANMQNHRWPPLPVDSVGQGVLSETKSDFKSATFGSSLMNWQNLWEREFLIFDQLEDMDSDSILTQPMPGWIFDLPRITSYYIYCDGKIYPNCLEVERRNCGEWEEYYWAKGCEKIGNSFYYREGNFRIRLNEDSSVILTKADGTSYIFPCEMNEESDFWIYRPLTRITGKSGNQITFSYDYDDDYYYNNYRVTIVDSVGRIVEVTKNGITVDGTPVVTYNVEGMGNGRVEQQYESITYTVTDAAGRTDTLIMGEDYLDLTSATGEKTFLQFENRYCDEPAFETYYNVYFLTGGESRGRELSVDYRFKHVITIYPDHNYDEEVSRVH